jgi:hypothetical protein
MFFSSYIFNLLQHIMWQNQAFKLVDNQIIKVYNVKFIWTISAHELKSIRHL